MYGTLSNSDTLNAFLVGDSMRLADFGEDRAYEAIMEYLAAHNRLVTDSLIPMFCEITTDQLRLYGGTADVEMQELSEFGVAGPQKISAGDNLGFPLRNYGASLQWTRIWMLTHTIREMRANVEAIQTADLKVVKREILRAIYYPTNITFVDRTSEKPLSIGVKRLLNADGFPIPADAYGSTFDPDTHTHYLANATFTAAALDTAIATVLEHNQAGADVRIYINTAQEAAIRTAADFPKFREYVDSRIIAGADISVARGTLDRNRTYDRAIGVYGPAEVWVKPWAIANYVVVHDASKKPLAYRHRAVAGYDGLRLAFEDEAHPLRAKGWEREFGVGANRREAAAVLQINNASYSAPTIA